MSSAVHSAFPALFSAFTVYFPESSLKTSGMLSVCTSPSWRISKSGELMISFPLRNHRITGWGRPATRTKKRTGSPSFTSVVLIRSTKFGGTDEAAIYIELLLQNNYSENISINCTIFSKTTTTQNKMLLFGAYIVTVRAGAVYRKALQ